MTDSPFADAGRIRADLHQAFTRQYPQGATLLPPGAKEMPQVVLDMAEFALTQPQEDAEPKLTEWALDLRRLGFPPAEYETVAGMLAEAAGLTEDDAAALTQAAALMRAASDEADAAGIPAAYAAQVNDVRQVDLPGSPIQIVRAECGTEIPYAPGQRLPVMLADRPGVWHEWVSAVPANAHGQVEFHVRSDEAPGIAPGALMVIGAPRGEPTPLDGEALELTAEGTSVAAAKAIVFALLEQPERPRVTLHYLGANDEERYELPVFNALARVNDWLEILEISASSSNR